MIKKILAHKWAIAIALMSAGLVAGPAALAATTDVPIAATVSAPAATTGFTVAAAYGSGALSSSQSTLPTTSSGVTGITFPSVTAGTSAVTTTATSYVELGISAPDATSGTTYDIAASSSGLVNSADSADTIPASDITLPGYGGGGHEWIGSSSGLASDVSGIGAAGTALSDTATTIYSNWSATQLTDVALQPQITIPANAAAGTYDGDIDLTVALN